MASPARKISMQKLEITRIGLNRDNLGLWPLPSEPERRKSDVPSGIHDHREPAGVENRSIVRVEAIGGSGRPGIVIGSLNQHDPCEIEVEALLAQMDQAEIPDRDRYGRAGGEMATQHAKAKAMHVPKDNANGTRGADVLNSLR
jgi:hypothetical protein